MLVKRVKGLQDESFFFWFLAKEMKNNEMIKEKEVKKVHEKKGTWPEMYICHVNLLVMAYQCLIL